MAVQEHEPVAGPPRSSLVNDPKVRGLFYQVLLILAIVLLGYVIVQNTLINLQRQNIAAGFDFLGRTAGFGIIQSMIPYSETSSYGRALVVGFLNTLLVAAIGIVLATILGFVVGIARLSNNWIISRLAYCYVELIRNIPLLLQIFFWYFAVLRSVPDKRDKWSFLFGTFHLNITGLRGPKPVYESGSLIVGVMVVLGIIAAIVIKVWARKRQEATGRQFPVFLTALGLIVGLPVLTYFITGMPISLDYPVFNETGPLLRRGFVLGTGFNLIPELLALTLALAIYTASFIAEIVRAGIQAVSHGQTEAAHALGLRPGPTLRLVIIPQAMRVIIPLTSQYLNLTKNSSLAVAIAYPDLVSVGGTVLNQTGQAIEVIGIWMAVYLSLSLATSAFMNWYNRRVALVER